MVWAKDVRLPQAVRRRQKAIGLSKPPLHFGEDLHILTDSSHLRRAICAHHATVKAPRKVSIRFPRPDSASLTSHTLLQKTP